MNKNQHVNKFLQNDFNIYGEQNFSFKVLRVEDDSEYDITQLEQSYIDRVILNNKYGCYNIIGNPYHKKNYDTAYVNNKKPTYNYNPYYNSYDVLDEMDKSKKSSTASNFITALIVSICLFIIIGITLPIYLGIRNFTNPYILFMIFLVISVFVFNKFLYDELRGPRIKVIKFYNLTIKPYLKNIFNEIKNKIK